MKPTPKFELRGLSLEASLDVRYSVEDDTVQAMVHLQVKDRVTGEPNVVVIRERFSGTAWEQMPDVERTRYVFLACLAALRHELAECFCADGVRVYDPHKDEKP